MSENFDDFADALNDVLDIYGPATRVAYAADLGALAVAIGRIQQLANDDECETAWLGWEKQIGSMRQLAREVTETTGSERQRKIVALRQVIRESGIVDALDSMPLIARTGATEEPSAAIALQSVTLRLATELEERSVHLIDEIRKAREARVTHEGAVKTLAEEAQRVTAEHKDAMATLADAAEKVTAELNQSSAVLDATKAIQEFKKTGETEHGNGHRWRLASMVFGVVGIATYLPLLILQPSSSPATVAGRIGVLVTFGALAAYCDRQGREHRWWARYYYSRYLSASAFLYPSLDPELHEDIFKKTPPLNGFRYLHDPKPGPLGRAPRRVPAGRKEHASTPVETRSDDAESQAK